MRLGTERAEPGQPGERKDCQGRPAHPIGICTPTRAWEDVSHRTTLILSAVLLSALTSRAVSGQRPTASTIAHAVDSLAVRIVEARLTPALGVAVVVDGRTVLSKSYGMADVTNKVPADEQTLWYLASTSKSLTGFGVSLLLLGSTNDATSCSATVCCSTGTSRWAS